MMSSWWIVWMVFMLVCLVPPMAYGWGYKRWGPPFPRYIQARRRDLAMSHSRRGSFDYQAWGRGGDVVWLTTGVGALLGLSAVWWTWLAR